MKHAINNSHVLKFILKSLFHLESFDLLTSNNF